MLADPKGRYLFVNADLEGEALTLACIYAPNDKPLQFLSESLKALMKFSTGYIILGGDLNCYSDNRLDRTSLKEPKTVGKGSRGAWGSLQPLLTY